MNHQHDWYKSFFQGMALDMWSNALPHLSTDKEIKFVEEQLSVGPGAQLLDAPAGFGRHTLALAQKGFRVTAIDIAEEYVRQIRKEADESALPVRAIQADLLDYVIDEQCDGAICMGNSFGYFPYEGMLKFCTKINDALKPGSKFIINSGIIAEAILPNMLGGNRWMEVGDMLYLREHSYIPNESVMKSSMKFIRGGKIETGVAYYYIFTLAEIRRMLEVAGFGDVKAFGNLEGAEFKFGDPQVYLVATKL